MRTLTYWIVGASCLLASLIIAQTRSTTERNARKLVVMIDGTMAGDPTYGAGVVFSQQGERLYIATANHVLRDSGYELENATIKVWYERGKSSVPVSARIDSFSDAEMDVGVLIADLPPSVLEKYGSPSANAVGAASAASDGKRVVSIGHPEGKLWNFAADGTVSDEAERGVLTIDAATIRSGFSGGGVFTNDWELIGMVTNVGTYTASALPASTLIDRLRIANFAVDLRSPDPAQIVSFVSDTSAVTPGRAARLSWVSRNAIDCSITGLGRVEPTGSTEVRPASRTDYRLVCSGSGGQPAAAEVSVAVEAQEIASFTATPSSLRSGASTRLTWSTTGVSQCTLDQGIGPVPANGTTEVTIISAADVTLTIRCEARNDVLSRSVKLTMLAAPVITSFIAEPSVVTPGGSTLLRWTVADADRCSIEGIGQVSSNSTTVTISAPTDYTLTCQGAGGSTARTVHIDVPRSVLIETFSTVDDWIDKGKKATLLWTARNATRCWIDNGVGIVDVSGSTEVKPNRSTTYKLTCEGVDGPALASARVKVHDRSDDDDVRPARVYCCDNWGRKWCQITQGNRSLGASCFCYGIVGSGFICE